ncbi:MAG: hypothetical protein U0X39_15835 [Bacteroidales bacterium]
MTGIFLKNIRYFAALLVLLLVILVAGTLIIVKTGIPVTTSSLYSLSVFFAIITFVMLFVVFAGLGKEPKQQPFYTLAAISIKMLAEMVAALVFFIGGKKSSYPDVILFFVLYLSFAMFSTISILKALKKKTI